MPAISALPPAASITDLRDRMRSKLDNFKKDRGIDEEDTDPQSRAALEAARRQRRGEIRDNRRRERKEARRKERAEPTAKTAKVSVSAALQLATIITADTISNNFSFLSSLASLTASRSHLSLFPHRDPGSLPSVSRNSPTHSRHWLISRSTTRRLPACQRKSARRLRRRSVGLRPRSVLLEERSPTRRRLFARQ